MTSASIGSSPSSQAQFEKSVRRLNSQDSLRHKRNKSISLQYNPYEQQPVSSLSVTPQRSPHRTSTVSLQHVLEEPDFGSEERCVWSSRSPANRPSLNKDPNFTSAEAFVSPNLYRGRRTHLRELQPTIVVSSELDERPKTRRGPSGPSAFESMNNSGGQKSEDEDDVLARKAKFTEGTMNTKSKAIASTWSDSEYATSSSEAEETDSEATPKAGRKRRSGSLDLRDFQPPMLTPSAIKRTLFKRREGRNDKKSKNVNKLVKEEQMDDDGVQKPRKRLRKSMSKLQFLGEKMKIFGSSSHSLHEQAECNTAQNRQDDQTITDERKRKAEVAYAEQFGFKKQKDNTGLGSVTRSAVTLSDQDHTYGNQKYDSSTVRCRGSTARSRRTSTGSIFNEQSIKDIVSINDQAIKRRPSRRELEEENQKLRALLKVSQAANEPAPLCASDSEPIPPIPPLRIRRNSTSFSEVKLSNPDNNTVSQEASDTTVPPLPPQHPDRRALANVSNRRSNQARRRSFGMISDNSGKENPLNGDTLNPLFNAPRLAPTPTERSMSLSPRRSLSTLSPSFSMIIEEPENEIDEKKRSLRSRNVMIGKENKVSAATLAVVNGGTKEEWQWPDDVF